MSEFFRLIEQFPLFGLVLTLASFYLGQRFYQHASRNPLLQPVVIGTLITVLALWWLNVSYDRYFTSAYPLHLMLGPATVALSVPLFQNVRRIRELLLPLFCTVLVGGVFTVSSAIIALWCLGGSLESLLAMQTKSVTTPIAMAIAEQTGSSTALSAMFVLITGALGAMIGLPIMNRLGIKEDSVKGFTLGLTSHAIGTARALEESRECGAFSALAMGLTGVLTALIVPWLSALL